MKQIFFFIFLGIILSVHGQSTSNQLTVEQPGTENKLHEYTCKIIPAMNGTWCYDIYNNGKKIIHQPSIPGFPGNEGCKKKSDAKRVARLVIKKLKKGEMPPTITMDEMMKLKILETIDK